MNLGDFSSPLPLALFPSSNEQKVFFEVCSGVTSVKDWVDEVSRFSTYRSVIESKRLFEMRLSANYEQPSVVDHPWPQAMPKIGNHRISSFRAIINIEWLCLCWDSQIFNSI